MADKADHGATRAISLASLTRRAVPVKRSPPIVRVTRGFACTFRVQWRAMFMVVRYTRLPSGKNQIVTSYARPLFRP